MRSLGLVAVALAAVAALTPPVARAAPAAPELFVAEIDASNPDAAPDWVPLSGAKMTGGYRYRLGVRLQASSDFLKRAYLLVGSTATPRQPSHGSAFIPTAGACAQVRGEVGEIFAWGTASYFGDGAYALTARMADYAPGPCPTGGGPETTGTFTVDARPTVTIVDPRANDRRPASTFRGVQLTTTTDSFLPEVVCALDPVVQPNGSLKGSVVSRADSDLAPVDDGILGFAQADAFPDSGRWACVARARGGPENVATGWSSPVFATVRGDFSVRAPTMVDPTYPTYAVRFRVDRGAAGGVVTFRLRSCKPSGKLHNLRRLPTRRLTLHARVSPTGNATVRFKRRVSSAQFGRYFVGRAEFSGNALIDKGSTLGFFAFSEFTDSFDGPLLGVFEEKQDCRH